MIFQDPEYDLAGAGIIGASSSSSKGGGEDHPSVLMPHSHEERMRRRIAARMAVEDENSVPRTSVTVRVPASSANCGPGYDCVGLAVDLWTEVTVSRSDAFEITAEGDGASEMPKDGSNLLVTGVKAAYETAGKPMPPLRYHVVSRIPYARGLGSSSAAIVAGIIAGLVLAGHRLPVWGSESLLQIAATIEGHPDNVAPVSYHRREESIPIHASFPRVRVDHHRANHLSRVHTGSVKRRCSLLFCYMSAPLPPPPPPPRPRSRRHSDFSSRTHLFFSFVSNWR